MSVRTRPEILYKIFTPTTSIKGVGPRISNFINKIAGPNIVDLLWHLPTGIIDRKYSPDLVVVDGVYLLSDDSTRAKWEQNDNLFKGLKNIAMAHEIPVFCTTQAGREAVDLFKPPKLNQVANGDALVRASDIAFAMSKVEDEDNQRYLYYMKQRDDVEIKDKSVLHWDVDIGDVQELMQEDVRHDAKF